ncbi:LCP family protein [Weissella soli]|uniref:LytR family transcriptional attenuator n=1 Tax=Weissella soli TaxID=155866 RepID=A0A288Q770_9LACO|nr:LCP family protein [Weissella soli]AOT57077.1 Putative transcriptional regulator YvhJ [Weissella soli]NKY83951.1 LytR family transcriptional regulator [Weissella soli]RDL01087.1 LytR family transcriptional attenuator [Weissella soli]GEN93866.1 LytR family transcriptional regulator [Weissella soli]GJM48807.1 LytR family transcriptional regulator [Weissella soli]
MDNEPKNSKPTRSTRHQGKLESRNARKARKASQTSGVFGRIKWRRVVFAVIALLAVATGVVGARVYHNLKTAADDSYKASGVKKSRDVSKALKQGKPISILLMGTDTGALNRPADDARTDSMMVVTINPKTNKTTVTSIERDIVTAVPGYENLFPQKMNAAYTDGGVKATIKTIQKYLNVPIDYYALVNMNGIQEIVNKLDGLKVVSPLTFTYNPDEENTSAQTVYSFTKGKSAYKKSTDNGVTWKTYQKLDGEAALAFSRMRYDDPEGDYGRQKRQRLVVQAIVDKAKSNPTKLVNAKFLSAMSDSAQTDLTFNDLMTIVEKYIGAAGNITQDHLQGTEVSLAGQSFQIASYTEKQRITNKLRKQLGLTKAETGSLYAGEVSDTTLSLYGLVSDAQAKANATAESTTSSSTTTTTGTVTGTATSTTSTGQ